MADFDRDYFVAAFRRMAETAEINRDEWTKLDGDIGDGDHGINMSIGFREVVKQLDALPDDTDVAGLFKLVGMTLLRKVGGASGPLYGSFFMKAGAEVAGQSEVSFDDVRRMLRAGVTSIQQRGKAELGDKTMLDSYLPGLDVLEAADAGDPGAALDAFVARMRQGSDDTIPLVAKKGRAMRLGERSVGHRDPGSQSSWQLMNCLLEEYQARA
ncbi:dihydroxyacetone kinase subunit DhaL [Micropruina sp.]|uniref:dihydroxyacetone kinase subunit DhaL n=1 Tax=Micropruina sp. TaxID=2737536 RepID=UPI0039E6D260